MLALGVGGFFVAREGQGRMFPEQVELGSVSLMSPAVQDVTLVATGYVYPKRRATIAPKITGRLSRLLVDEGALVKEGQIVAELETSDVQAQLAQVRADIAAAKARAERARADLSDANIKLNREKSLVEKSAGTKATYDDAESRVTSARAQIAAAEAEVRATEARQAAVGVLSDATRVRAPFAGTLVRKLSEVGEVLAVGGGMNGPSGVFTIASLDDLEVQADVSEAQYGKVKVGTPAEILLDAFSDKRFRGEVSDIRQTIDRAKASVTVKVKFTDPSTGVLPDMAAKVSFLSKALDDAALKATPKVIAPADSIVTRGADKIVFVYDDKRAKEVVVTVGDTLGTQVEIKQGLSPGTRVVRNPSPALKGGFPIEEKKK